MPARRLFFLLALVGLLLVGALADLRMAWAALGLDALLLGAFAVDLVRARRTSLTAERVWPPLLVQGAPAAVTVRLSGDRAAEVRLREGLAPALAAGPRRALARLRPGLREGRGSGGGGMTAASTWTYRVIPRRRGEAEAAPLTARVLGPWRLAWSQRALLGAERRRVYPQVRWEGRVGHLLALAQRNQLGSMPLSWQGAGSEPYALRQYRAGDPPGKIHWKASARHGHLITREETWERGARLVILLDTARTMASSAGTGASPADGAGVGASPAAGRRAGERSKLDHALAASLALARVAAARGDRVTFIAFSDRVERTVAVTGGSRGMAAAYEALFDLEARAAEPAYDLAAREVLARETRSATVVLFTSVVDLAAAELLKESVLQLERRHRPMLINLQDPELVALAHDAPEEPEDAFAQVAAMEILLAGRRLGARLRRAGVRVVSTPADRLALDTLEAYLALFRTRLAARRGRVGARRTA